jgi:hypothetical protein
MFRLILMVPTLCVVTQQGTLLRPEPQSGLDCIPTRSVGTIGESYC